MKCTESSEINLKTENHSEHQHLEEKDRADRLTVQKVSAGLAGWPKHSKPEREKQS